MNVLMTDCSLDTGEERDLIDQFSSVAIANS